MLSQFTLLDGDLVSVDAPDVTLSPPVVIGVLYADSTEIEVNAGTQEAADLFLEITGTKLTSQLTLRGDRTLHVGPLGGDRANGWGYVVEIGDDRVFGPTPPSVTVERLAAVLADTSPARNGRGVVLQPNGSATWSPFRTQGASQMGTRPDGTKLMLDIRRAVPGQKRSSKGLQVRGGSLTKQNQHGRDYVILENPDFVIYGLPIPEIELNDLAGTVAEVLVERR